MDASVFALSIRRYADKFKLDMDALARGVCFQLAENVVLDTPVDTGFLRGSWQPSLGAPKNADGAEAGQSRSLAELGLVISEMKAGDRFWMTNNAAYARRLEYGFVGTDSLGRTYDQKGRYFVTDNIKRAPAVLAAVAKDLSK